MTRGTDESGETLRSQSKRNHYEAVTRGIRVTVEPHYLSDQSKPEDNRHVWAYVVNIINEGSITVQLKDRTWVITDGAGRVENVHGPGVVGEQPILNPGDKFQYSSGCPLTTDSGFMAGHYTMQSEASERFEVEIPAFALDLPDAARVVN